MESLTLTLITALFVTPPAALSDTAEPETYTEGDIVPVVLILSNPIATGFTVEWEVKPGSEDEGTPTDESDYSVTSGRSVITPSDGVRVHLGDIRLIKDNVVEGPEIFYIYLTGVFNTVPGIDPMRINLGPPRCIMIIDNKDPPLPPDPPDQNNDDEEENWTSSVENTNKKRRGVRICPVGWVKSDFFGNPTKRVILHAVEVAIDIEDRSGIYKPVAIEIYADPAEELSDLDGWKLTLAVPYNYGRDYYLTTENSTFNENGIARIESPPENPFPMTDVQFSGRWLPGFDYRLFNEHNVRVDFGISCYRHAGLQERLHAMEIPRVERDIIPPAVNDEVLESVSWRTRLDWTQRYYLSVYLVPKVAPSVPRAPAAVRKPLATSWATLKKP